MRRSPAMDRRRRLLLLLLLVVVVVAVSAAADKQALLQFKRSISTDPAGLLSLWIDSPDSDCCSWPGASCNAASRVTALNISAATPSPRSSSLRRSFPDESRRMVGKLSPALVNLSELRILSLPFHHFRGDIPREIWRLQKLEVLDLEGSSLSGTLPSGFPPALAVLNLASNRIQGEIPEPSSRCRNLEILDVSGNRLSGAIPSFLGDLHKLRRLDLSGNLLVGGIPGNLGNCTELESLLLFSNLLAGSIPSDLGRLGKLRVLDVSRNSLSGKIPVGIGRCVELAVFVLLNPDDSVAAEEVRSYRDSGEFNYFQGGIPGSVTALPKLRVLWAPRGMLVGEIPSNWSKCESLEMVNLGHNLFTGNIPEGLPQCKNLKYLNLSSNKLVGFVDEQLLVPCMDVFDVSGNLLTGFIPKFAYKSCPKWQLSDDDLASAYYTFFAYRSRARSSITYFKSGSGYAVNHDFGQNKFSGTLGSLPLATEKYDNRTVYAFLADGNYLYGELNDLLFDKCNALTGLIANFSNNLISGGIPVEIGRACRPLIVLDVAGNQITEAVPRSLGLLGSLSVLDMSRNQLSGEIPSSFGGLKRLEYLSLAHNNMSGRIPTELVQLHSLKLLDLSSNILTGEVPGGLVYLRNLTTLLLNNNKLSGKIPSGLTNATSLSMFNFSFNDLSGPLPVNAGRMSCDVVLGNPLLQTCHGVSLSVPPPNLQEQSGNSQIYPDSPSESPPTGSGSSGFSSIEIASIASAASIFSVLVTLVILYVCTKKCFPRSLSPSYGRREVIVFMDIGVPLTYEGVVQATGCFNASNCIGSGGFGATYKAEVSPGVMVAIKRLSIGRLHGIQQFHAEVKTLGRWRHPNLVTLIGYHLSDAEMFLVYNYLPGGNLERFIHERSRRLVDWRMLHKIAVDVARALAYLHDHCVPRILHRDVKPSNILLDNDYNAYLSDFGLARLLGNSETHATTGVAGTFGYVAPEYAMTCRVSDKADVYSYGVVILELISDKKALDPSFSPYGNGFNIVTWASMLLRQGRAREVFNEGVWDVGPHDDLVETLHLAVKCTDDSLSIRPTMKQVVRRLKELQHPPL